jgi:hypothetical protein
MAAAEEGAVMTLNNVPSVDSLIFVKRPVKLFPDREITHRLTVDNCICVDESERVDNLDHVNIS